MRSGVRLVACLLALVPWTRAVAQEPPPAEPAEPEIEVEEEPTPTIPVAPVEDEGPIPEPDVPEDPLANLPPEPSVEVAVRRHTKADYPIERVKRPLTLAADQLEVGLDVPLVLGDGHPVLTQVLSGAFGVTVDLEIGLTYAVGAERLSARAGEDGFEPGKALSIDAAYTILPRYLAVQARVAFLIDPDVFGVGLILGLPYKIEVGDRWAIFGGADLVRLRLNELAVDPADPAGNAFLASEIGRGVEPGIGSGHLHTGAMFQARPDVALEGVFGIHRDFDTDDQRYSLFAGATYSPSRRVDLGARAGLGSLDDPAETFQVAVFGAGRL